MAATSPRDTPASKSRSMHWRRRVQRVSQPAGSSDLPVSSSAGLLGISALCLVLHGCVVDRLSESLECRPERGGLRAERGVGSRARVTAVAGGRTETIDIEVIEAERPARNVERNVGADGRRVATGTYVLADLPDGGTRVTFEYAWRQAPWSERLAAPVIRAIVRRGNERALQRLAAELQDLKV
jgi:hypothetical protein